MIPARQMLEDLPRDRLLAEYSLWSADLVRIADDVARTAAHADIYHADVADGHFAPAMLLFPDLVAQIAKIAARPIHVHLMVANAILLEQVRQFAEAGAHIISVHAEHADAGVAIDLITSLGLVPGMVLQLETPVAAARPFLDRLGMLTLLGTRMGIKGVGLDPSAPARLGEAKALIAHSGKSHRILLAADGGIRETTVPSLRQAGAETIVMGSLAFGAPDLAARMAWVHGLGATA